ncbi:hypothetical protein QWZ16_11945 [Vibrio ostreicida]|uniref:Uncharacterized protein n=1 Tax=Vibrio ostreicida TaxID=526588 RepID=A0ABT8BWE3_9VIBR|nr:hypothetical protein [Vibrio ostreicida]MDN3610417.1 hypothetical protein [Vibrio ostreicida]
MTANVEKDDVLMCGPAAQFIKTLLLKAVDQCLLNKQWCLA